MSSNKEVNRVIRYAEAHGFAVRKTKKHIKLKKHNKTIIMAGTPSCPFGYKHALEDIQKLMRAHGEEV